MPLITLFDCHNRSVFDVFRVAYRLNQIGHVDSDVRNVDGERDKPYSPYAHGLVNCNNVRAEVVNDIENRAQNALFVGGFDGDYAFFAVLLGRAENFVLVLIKRGTGNINFLASFANAHLAVFNQTFCFENRFKIIG